MRKRSIVIGAVAVAVIGAGGAGTAVWASQEDDAEKRGTMGAASYELAVEPEDSGLEVTFELQSSAPDEAWQVRVDHDGTTILSGERRTDEDAELDIDVPTRDHDGSDEFEVTVTGPDGQEHTAEITY